MGSLLTTRIDLGFPAYSDKTIALPESVEIRKGIFIVSTL